MTDSEGPEPQGWERTLKQMFDLYFTPEIERRREAGELPADFNLFLAQVLFPQEGPPQVRLNDEVAGVAQLRTERPVEKGEPVLLTDLEHITAFDLPDEWLDSGHFTAIRSAKHWGMFFNFLSGRAKVRDMLELAVQFLAASVDSASKGHNGPAVDNLFSATELVAKAELILTRDPASKAKTHGPVASRINAWAKLGNIDAAFVALFNRLGQQRPNARYADRDNRPPAPSRDDFDIVRAVIERGLERVTKTTERDSEREKYRLRNDPFKPPQEGSA